MKLLLLIYSLIVFTTIKSQSLEEKLKFAVIKAENENYMGHHKDAKIVSTEIVVHNYTLIPLRDWWKDLYEVHHSFSLLMDKLSLAMKLADSVNGTHLYDSSVVEQQKETKQPSFDGEAYFKQKYESTDPAIKVYQVYYSVNLKAGDGNGYSRDSVRMCLYPKDLTEVKSFEK